MTKEWLRKVDFPRLRRQRALLRAVAYKFADEDRQPEHQELLGLNNLLDDFMDHAASVLGERKVFGPKGRNENCLQGIRCPKCRHEKDFSIVVETSAGFTDDGCVNAGDMDWGEFSWITCGKCDHVGRVWEFQR